MSKTPGKRGGRPTMVSLDGVSPAVNAVGPTNIDVLALDEALGELASFDVQQCRIVEMRFFAGLTMTKPPMRSVSRRRPWKGNGRWQRRGSTSAYRPGSREADVRNSSERGEARTEQILPLSMTLKCARHGRRQDPDAERRRKCRVHAGRRAFQSGNRAAPQTTAASGRIL